MFLYISRAFTGALSFLTPCLALADEEVPSIGEFAALLIEPVSIVSDFIGSASMIVGVVCIFSAFLRYMQFRINPLASPISTVIVLLILGIVLLCLPFLSLLTGTGVPFPHYKI